MARLSRFEEHRYVGTRDDMRVYDCDDDDQFVELSERVAEERLVEAKMLQTFAPDSISDARNRGFRPF
ncbi:MAG: hypothetical protein M3132_00795 [Actinomycetia bacterium]|nr:hypothetical protein [Actinomycetes bacterium]